MLGLVDYASDDENQQQNGENANEKKEDAKPMNLGLWKKLIWHWKTQNIIWFEFALLFLFIFCKFIFFVTWNFLWLFYYFLWFFCDFFYCFFFLDSINNNNKRKQPEQQTTNANLPPVPSFLAKGQERSIFGTESSSYNKNEPSKKQKIDDNRNNLNSIIGGKNNNGNNNNDNDDFIDEDYVEQKPIAENTVLLKPPQVWKKQGNVSTEDVDALRTKRNPIASSPTNKAKSNTSTTTQQVKK